MSRVVMRSVWLVTELRLGVELQYDRNSQEYQDAIDALDRLVSHFDVLPIGRSIANRGRGDHR